FLRPHPSSLLFPYTTLFRSFPLGICNEKSFKTYSSLYLNEMFSNSIFELKSVLTCAFAESFNGLGVSIISCILSAAALPCLILRSEEHTSELQSRENLVCRL